MEVTSLDRHSAINMVQDVLDTLKQIRENAIVSFSEILRDIEETHDKLRISVSVPGKYKEIFK